MKQTERVDLIIKFEEGETNKEETLKLFSHLIKTGLCWNLQGHYGRTAKNLIDNNIITDKGEINLEVQNEWRGKDW